MSAQPADPATADSRPGQRRRPLRLALLTVLLVAGLVLGACGGGNENGGGGATSAGGATSGTGGSATTSGDTVGLNQLPSATEELGTTEGNP